MGTPAALDPVHLMEGREDLGKPEIVEERGEYRYQFVSEPSRAKFAEDPARFSIQNDSCSESRRPGPGALPHGVHPIGSCGPVGRSSGRGGRDG